MLFVITLEPSFNSRAMAQPGGAKEPPQVTPKTIEDQAAEVLTALRESWKPLLQSPASPNLEPKDIREIIQKVYSAKTQAAKKIKELLSNSVVTQDDLAKIESLNSKASKELSFARLSLQKFYDKRQEHFQWRFLVKTLEDSQLRFQEFDRLNAARVGIKKIELTSQALLKRQQLIKQAPLRQQQSPCKKSAEKQRSGISKLKDFLKSCLPFEFFKVSVLKGSRLDKLKIELTILS